MTISLENEKNPSSSTEWRIDSDEKIFVTRLNSNSDKLDKPINYYLDGFIITSLNHMSIRSHLMSQQKNEQIFNNERNFILRIYCLKHFVQF